MRLSLLLLIFTVAGCADSRERAQDPTEVFDDGGLLITPSTCLRIEPVVVEFGAVPPDGRATQQIEAVSCGTEPVTASIGAPEPSATFQWQVADFTLAPGARTPIDVSFSPVARGAFRAEMHIESNDPRTPTQTVTLLGRGGPNLCPEGDVTAREIAAEPLDTITLDGGPSVDPDGEILRYEWIVTDRPPGSTAAIVEVFSNPNVPARGGPDDDLETPTAQFFVDLAGHYRFELRVTDDEGLTQPSDACPAPAAAVSVEARPASMLHVQLVWHTPADPDETDANGTDMDLHFLHPLGQGHAWTDQRFDCYYGNITPNWGGPGAADNPSLDIDDVDGAGPENINLDELEATAPLGGGYRIGVHAYRGWEAPVGEPSHVTVRIYIGGDLLAELRETLDRPSHFWNVADVHWGGAGVRVEPLDDLYILDQ